MPYKSRFKDMNSRSFKHLKTILAEAKTPLPVSAIICRWPNKLVPSKGEIAWAARIHPEIRRIKEEKSNIYTYSLD